MRLRLLFISVILLSQIGIKAQESYSNIRSKFTDANAVSNNQPFSQVTTSTADNQMLLGYSPEEVASHKFKSLGTTTAANLGYAIYIPDRMAEKYKGNELKAIWFGLYYTDYSSNYKVWIKSELEDTDFIYSQDVPSVIAGWNQIELDSPLTIDGNGFYIGVTFSISQRSFPFGISGEDTENGLYLLTEYGQWINYSESGRGRINILGLVEGENLPLNFAGLVKSYTNEYYYQPEETITANGTIENWGKNTIRSCDIVVKLNNGEEKIYPQIVNISPRYSTSFSGLELPAINEMETGRYPVSYTVKNVNGIEDPLYEDSKNAEVFVYSGTTLERKILLEEFTTELDTWGPSATLRINNIARYNENIVWVIHHTGYETDAYTIEESDYYIPFFGPSTFAPGMMLDRSWFPESECSFPVMVVPERPNTIIKKALNQPAFITVNIEGYYDEEKNEVTVKVSGESILDMATLADNPLLTIFITEDGIISQTQLIGENAIPIKDYEHDNLIRRALTHPYGDEVIWDGNSYTYITKATLNSSWKAKNLKVIAFIHNLDEYDMFNCRVLNAEWIKMLEMETPTSIQEISVNELTVACENGEVYIQGNYDSFEIYNSNGSQIINRNLLPGIYIVRILSDNKIINKKVISK